MGGSTSKEVLYSKKESGGIGPVTVEENSDGTTTINTDMNSRVEVNAVMVGVEAGINVSYTTTTKSNSTDQPTQQSNQPLPREVKNQY